jgi:hypothetical protein
MRFSKPGAPSFREKLVFGFQLRQKGWVRIGDHAQRLAENPRKVVTGISSLAVVIGDCGFLAQTEDVISS